MSHSRLRRLFCLPVITGTLIAGLMAWMFASGNVMRSFAAILLVLLWLLLTGLWWVVKVKGRRLARLAVLILLAGLVTGASMWLLRYDGSSDGTAMPRFSWRWSQPARAPEADSKTHATIDLSSMPAGLADSPRFMGPAADGIIPGAAFATDWKSHPPREVWRKPVGIGWSGFSVAGRRAITQEQRDDKECVTCYDISTGNLLWMHEDQARFSERMGGDGPRATPTIDAAGKAVFTMGATGILNCLDLESGARRWSRPVLADWKSGNLTWGRSCSPLLHGDLVIVSGGTSGPALIALQRDTGATVWQGGDEGASYSSPALRSLAGRDQIVSVNQKSVTGHDPASGAVLWSFPWPGDFPKVSQPIPAGPDRILVTSSYGVKSHLLEIKADSSGRLTAAVVWSSKAPRTKFSSPSIFEGFAIGMDEGTLACISLTTGQRRWREGRYGYGQHLITGGLMLIQGEPGFVALVKPNPDRLDEIARIPAMNSMTWNPPTLAGRWLLVRNDREAVCFELPAKE